MSGELVVDASVAVKWFITEDDSAVAAALAGSGSTFIAPDLILAELASVAAKRVRRGDIAEALGRLIVSDGPKMFDSLVPVSRLVEGAFATASATRVSLYDALYLTLAKQRGTLVVTADARLIVDARAAGLEALVREL
jgi:predicted nucleic acid-binding protein